MVIDRNKLAPIGFIPKRVYSLFIKAIKQDPTQKDQTPQDVLECEILAPEIVAFGDKQCVVGGQEISVRLMYGETTMYNSLEFWRKLGVGAAETAGTTEELQAVTKDLANNAFDIVVGSREEFARRQLTPEEIAKGLSPYADELIVKDEATGEKIMAGYRVDADIRTVRPGTFRAAQRPANRPY